MTHDDLPPVIPLPTEPTAPPPPAYTPLAMTAEEARADAGRRMLAITHDDLPPPPPPSLVHRESSRRWTKTLGEEWATKSREEHMRLLSTGEPEKVLAAEIEEMSKTAQPDAAPWSVAKFWLERAEAIAGKSVNGRGMVYDAEYSVALGFDPETGPFFAVVWLPSDDSAAEDMDAEWIVTLREALCWPPGAPIEKPAQWASRAVLGALWSARMALEEEEERKHAGPAPDPKKTAVAIPDDDIPF